MLYVVIVRWLHACPILITYIRSHNLMDPSLAVIDHMNILRSTFVIGKSDLTVYKAYDKRKTR